MQLQYPIRNPVISYCTSINKWQGFMVRVQAYLVPIHVNSGLFQRKTTARSSYSATEYRRCMGLSTRKAVERILVQLPRFICIRTAAIAFLMASVLVVSGSDWSGWVNWTVSENYALKTSKLQKPPAVPEAASFEFFSSVTLAKAENLHNLLRTCDGN